MKITPGEKLIINMLADLYSHLGVQSPAIDPTFVLEVMNSGNAWAIKAKYGEMFADDDISEETVKETRDALVMWSLIERSVENLNEDERERLKVEAAPFGNNPRWPGFDHNNEGDHYSVARVMIEQFGDFPEFASRVDLNSHSSTRDITARMLPVFNAAVMRMRGYLTVDDLIAILNARRHGG